MGDSGVAVLALICSAITMASFVVIWARLDDMRDHVEQLMLAHVRLRREASTDDNKPKKELGYGG